MAGRILRMALCSATKNGLAKDEVRVQVTLNAKEIAGGIITKPAGQLSAYTVFNPAIEVNAGNVINFITNTFVQSTNASVVSLIIEVDHNGG